MMIFAAWISSIWETLIRMLRNRRISFMCCSCSQQPHGARLRPWPLLAFTSTRRTAPSCTQLTELFVSSRIASCFDHQSEAFWIFAFYLERKIVQNCATALVISSLLSLAAASVIHFTI